MRYLFFITWYRQWFNNLEGIKGFANQAIHWLLRSTLRLAARLKRQNKQLAEKIKELTAELSTRILHPTIDADEYAALKGKFWRYSLAKFIFVTADFFFNFFAANSIITSKDWGSRIGQLLLALAMTYGFILLFEELFEELLHLKPYKGEHKEGRKWGKLITLSILSIAYEVSVYYLCKVRGIEIEGGTGDGIVSTLMMLIGMLSPILAGYYDYMKGLFIAAYRNTNRIVKLRHIIATKENRIATNKQKMENHFKRQCNGNWAYLQEFRIYKENWNNKHSIPEENLEGHFAESQETFIKEAITRYKKEALQTEALKPDLILTPATAQNTRYDGEIEELFAC